MADRRRNDTKKRIIELTLGEIEEKGYLNLPQREICRKFGISNTAFYYHFENKEHLFHEVLSLASGNLFDEYNRNVVAKNGKQNSIDNLMAYGNFLLTMFQTRPNLMEFIFFSPAAFHVYSISGNIENTDYPLLQEVFSILDSIKNEYNLKIERHNLLVKWWSFFYGYLLLGKASVLEYNDFFLKDVIMDIISRDIAGQFEDC